MIWNLFKKASKSFIGVDIGTFSVKIVELSRSGKRRKLENYGEMQAVALYEKPFRTFEKSTLTVSSRDVVRAILAILGEAGIKTNKAYLSIPDFSSFFTTFTLPQMTEEELPQAVNYEARQHIPLPLSEVTLDWQIIGRKAAVAAADKKLAPFKILLVVVPNEIVQQYQEIASASGLELLALEAEVFGLARAIVKEEAPVVPGQPKEKPAQALVDIGARSTTVSIIDNGILKISHSFDSSGNDLTNVISKGLNVDYKKAEELKQKQGLLPSEVNGREAMMPLVDLILNEIKKISQNFSQTENKEVQKVILAGGSAFLPGLADYFQKSLGVSVEIANPFSDLYCPPILEETLKKMGPSYAIAVGIALRGLE